MTEKEKAKAYDMAIERAKKLHNVPNMCKIAIYDNRIIEEIFPELNDSEDEKIKNAILNHLKKMWGNCQDDVCGVHVEDAIDWLETQGKKSNWKPSKEEMDVLYSLSYITNEYDEYKEDVITNLYQDLKREFFNYSSYENMFSLDNKEDDVRCISTIQDVDRLASVFTIQDAIDGDVIHLGTVTAIFKKYIGGEKCICYCSFCEDGGFEIPIENGDDNVYGCYNATPATKEQRDTFMKAMNDAGYEWDIEHKELKKKNHKK